MIRHLAGSLILALICIAAGYGLFALAHHDVVRTRSQHEKLRTDALAVRDRLQHTQQDEPAVRLAIQQFDALSKQGVIGPERRLDWADSLRQLQQALRLPKAEFTLQPQRRLGPVANAAPYSLYLSPMLWRARLLHEGDLLRILAAVRNIPSSVVVPSQCMLTGDAASTSTPTGLEVECQFDWLTIAPDTAAKEQP